MKKSLQFDELLWDIVQDITEKYFPSSKDPRVKPYISYTCKNEAELNRIGVLQKAGIVKKIIGRHRNRIEFTVNGRKLAELYQEWNDKFPELFGTKRLDTTTEQTFGVIPSLTKEEASASPKHSPIPSVQFGDKSLCCGEIEAPMERGHRKMMEILLRKPTVYRGKRLVAKGEAVNRTVLQKEGGYKDQAAWRNALNKLRSKINDAGFPLKIESDTKNHYIAEIRYPQSNSRK